MNAGNLLPDALILRVIREHFMRAHSEGSDKFLLDGFPRTGEQVRGCRCAAGRGRRRAAAATQACKEGCVHQ